MAFDIDLNEPYNDVDGVADGSPVNENRVVLPIDLNVQPYDEDYIFDLNVVPSLEDDCVNDVENVTGGNEADDIFRGKLVSFIEAEESIMECNQMSFLFLSFFLYFL